MVTNRERGEVSSDIVGDKESDKAYMAIAKMDGRNVIAVEAERTVTGSQQREKSGLLYLHGVMRTR